MTLYTTTEQVEILKIGGIMTTEQFNGLRRLNIVCDGGPIFDYYKNIVINNTSNVFEFYETQKIFVGSPLPYNPSGRLIGLLDNHPLIGQPFTINNRYWQSSRVASIIENFIIITKNSVYAIHHNSFLRDKKLNELGI